MAIIFRKGTAADLDGAAAVYEAVFERQARGVDYTNWLPGVYPVRATAEKALGEDSFYVGEEEGRIGAAATLNHIQLPEYGQLDWTIPAEGEEVLVIHTLCIDPAWTDRGAGAAFVAFAEEEGRRRGCKAMRFDTYEGNEPAKRLYDSLGYRRAGVVNCLFMDGRYKNLIIFEKAL